MDQVLKDVTPDSRPPALTDAARAEIAALARRQRKAGGLLMKAVNFVGTGVEDGLKLLPAPARGAITRAAAQALTRSYDLAARSRAGGRGGLRAALARAVRGDRAHKVVAAATGAMGGAGGLVTTLAEIPVATAVIFRAVQGVAEAHGEDPGSEETRAECLRVFGAGGSQAPGDALDTAFLGARLSVTGVALNRLVSRVAPRFAAVLSQKVAGQAVPLLGAAAGATTNWAFMDYYVEMAHVHFGLRRLAREHGEAEVADEFHRVLAGAPARAA